MTSPHPKFDKDVELLKVNFVAEEWRGSLLLNVGGLLSAFITISVLSVASTKDLLGSSILVGLIGIFFVGWAYAFQFRPYKKRIRQLDVFLKKIYNGESIGDLETLLKK